MILLLDNYDSFTYNLQHYFRILNVDIKVVRNDDPDLSSIPTSDITGIVLSPGPGRPQEAGQMSLLIDQYVGKIPFLGVCLGHQALGEHFGAILAKAQKPKHGKLSNIQHTGHSMFHNIPHSLNVTRYHSLVFNDLAHTELNPTAFAGNGEIMAFAHKQLPVWGVQFHPEAVLTSFGHRVLNNWLSLFV